MNTYSLSYLRGGQEILEHSLILLIKIFLISYNYDY